MNNLTNENTTIVIGNPGCGKTTYLINKLKQLVHDEHVPLSEIAFCSFSVAAIQEAIERALPNVASYGQEAKLALPFFKTLHAMAFQLLGLSPNNLMTETQIQDFSKIIQMPLSYGNRIQDPTQKAPVIRQQRGDAILNIINAARLLDIPIRKYMAQNPTDYKMTVYEVEDIYSRYRDFKVMNDVYDYTDMLIMAKTAELTIPHWHTLIIDEAQDLSTLMWLLVDRMAEFSDNIIIAGDDKQSINSYNGADVDTFLSLPGKVKVLEQSYRVPLSVYNLANKIMASMTKFRPQGTKWRPRKEKGLVKEIYDLPISEMADGDWLILARGKYQLERIRDMIMSRPGDKPLLFTINGCAPIDPDIFRVISWFKEADLRGETFLKDLVTMKDEYGRDERAACIDRIRILKKFIPCPASCQPWEVTEGFLELLKKPWPEACTKISGPIKLYLSKLYPVYKEKGVELFADAKIRLMTIHSAKGREADNVILYCSLPRVVHTEMRTSSEAAADEMKVLYVGVTRAKQKLYLLKQRNVAKFLTYLNYI